ncbi:MULTISPECIES: hypothetical protein [unclassified Pseudoalteromonas]|uniref:hypothetical protein n=1 Tax=unclassified Pseudoalteromonas TaxID=194690 RepID=UPI003014450D
MKKFSYRTTIDLKEKLIHAAAYGDCVEDDIVNMYKNLGNYLKSNDFKHLLIDVSQLNITYDYPNVLTVLKKINEVLDGIAIARIVSPKDAKSGLIEAFAEKHQLKLRNFENQQDAVAWLSTVDDE